jgi:hypothetical protein
MLGRATTGAGRAKLCSMVCREDES